MDPVIPPIRLLSAVLCVTKVSAGLNVFSGRVEKSAVIFICSFFWKELAILSVIYASAFTFDRSMNVTTDTEGFTLEYFSI